MKQIEITYSRSTKINKGNYEQDSPMFSAKEIIQVNGEPFSYHEEYSRLRSQVDPLIEGYMNEWNQKLAKIRTRIKDGKKYISVTSVLCPDGLPEQVKTKEFGMVPMVKYSDRGTELHRLWDVWRETGKIEKPAVDVTPLRYDDVDLKRFIDTHKDRIGKRLSPKIEVFNDTHLYSGELDELSVVDGLNTLVDLKTGSWKWEQHTAYFKCPLPVKIEQFAVFDFKNNKIELLPVKDAVSYWENFLKLRGAITARFGI
jgi:hypothetical protein